MQSPRPLRFISAIIASFTLVGCLEDSGRVSQKELSEELEGQELDLARVEKFIKDEKEKLVAHQATIALVQEAAETREKLEELAPQIEEASTRNLELEGQIAESQLTLRKYQRAYRFEIRKQAKGEVLDLSESHGEEFRESRVLGIDPTGIRVYKRSGPVNIHWKELPEAIQKRFQFAEDDESNHKLAIEVAEAKLQEKLAQLKEGQAEREQVQEEQLARDEIVKKIRDTREEIERREALVRSRLSELQAWKSKASRQEGLAAEARNGSQRRRAMKVADMARETARQLAEANSDELILITRLKSEMEELKFLQKKRMREEAENRE